MKGHWSPVNLFKDIPPPHLRIPSTFTVLVGFVKHCKLEAQGPFTAHLITNSKQFSQKKDNQNERIQIKACVVGNTSVCCCEPLVWRRILSKEKPFATYFCPALDPLFGISGRNHYKNGSIPSKPFCLWSSLWLLLAQTHVRDMSTSSLQSFINIHQAVL